MEDKKKPKEESKKTAKKDVKKDKDEFVFAEEELVSFLLHIQSSPKKISSSNASWSFTSRGCPTLYQPSSMPPSTVSRMKSAHRPVQ